MSQPTEQPPTTTPLAATCTSCSCTSDLLPCADCGAAVCPAHAVPDIDSEQVWCLTCTEAYLE